MISSVIFDLGNVVNRWEPEKALLDLYETHEAALKAMDALGFKQWVGDILDSGEDYEASLAEIEAANPVKYEMLRTYMNNIHSAHDTPVEGTFEIIRKLADSGVRLFAMTNAGIPAFEAVKINFPALEMMEDIFVSAQEKLMKPNRLAFDLLLKRNDLSAEQCLFIDDAQANVDGAKAIGIHAVKFESATLLQTHLIELGLIEQEAHI